MKCKYCGRDRVMPCRSTREMEEMQEYGSGDAECLDELMKLGGGEYTVNRVKAQNEKILRKAAKRFKSTMDSLAKR